MHPHQHLYTLSNIAISYGCYHVVVSPGSRCAPLLYAFAAQNKFKLHQAVDERSAAFQALGIAEITNTPVVLICTSGTAAANYFPAVAEAHYKRVKLLVLTADRPPELLNQQDGQMIHQQHLFGPHVLSFCQLKTSYTRKQNKAYTFKLKQLFEACFVTDSGVLHLNIPLKDPLYLPLPPIKNVRLPKVNATTDTRENKIEMKLLTDAFTASEKVLVLIGNLPLDAALTTALIQLQKHPNVVVLADVSSNQTYTTTITNFDWLIEQAHVDLLKKFEPNLLISLGGPVLSKSLKLWLQSFKPKYHFRLQHTPQIINTYGNLTHRLIGNPASILVKLSNLPIKSSNYYSFWHNTCLNFTHKITKKLSVAPWSEISAMAKVLQKIPVATNLHLANSSVVRYVSRLGLLPKHVIVTANRGTSGIDGSTSTAVGAAKVNSTFTVLLTGDLAFLYDYNALWQNVIPANLRIIIFNNSGGGIFNLIDGPNNHKAYINYQTTPHQQNLKLLAQARDLEYYICADFNALDKTLDDFFNPLAQASVLELSFDLKTGKNLLNAFKKLT